MFENRPALSHSKRILLEKPDGETEGTNIIVKACAKFGIFDPWLQQFTKGNNIKLSRKNISAVILCGSIVFI